MSNLRGGSSERTEISNPSDRGHSGSRGRATDPSRRGRGRGAKANAANPTSSAGDRPTHFLALPLINHPTLAAYIKGFQKGLFRDVDGLNNNLAFESTARGKGSKVTKSSLVEGLDSSILIDPRRLHMTLGVMSLEQDDDSVEPPETTTPLGHLPKKTVSSALYLLNSLKPRISEILQSDKGIKVPLEVMHVFKTEKMRLNTKGNQGGGRDRKEGTSGRKQNETSEGGRRGDSGPSNVMPEKEAIGASVLYVAPEIKNQSVNADLRKLIQVSDFVHQSFKDAGYVTETRPLKLHCTILNTSHRNPRTRQPFCYSDILVSDALRILQNAGDSISRSKEGTSTIFVPEHELTDQKTGDSSSSIQRNLSKSALPPTISSSSNPSSKLSNVSVVKNSPSIPVNLGVFVVKEIQLWVMGSHGPNNEYISCGGIVLE